ncbi:MAG TPA: ferritin-like domain-containing protein [Steroidobacteraceae bacterium]|nr:ferritin-like domain-containing protein [Steroidobacteraceae bacterium]
MRGVVELSALPSQFEGNKPCQKRKESIGELEHADRLVVRIIFLEGFPSLQLLDPLAIGQSVKEVLDCDLGDQIAMLFAAVYESGCGPSRHFAAMR